MVVFVQYLLFFTSTLAISQAFPPLFLHWEVNGLGFCFWLAAIRLPPSGELLGPGLGAGLLIDAENTQFSDALSILKLELEVAMHGIREHYRTKNLGKILL